MIVQSQILKKTLKDQIQIFETVLGSGTYSKVYLGRNKNTDRWLACKTIDKAEIQLRINRHFLPQKVFQIRQKLISNLKKEVGNMKMINHPNIVRLLNFVETKNNCYIVLDYIPSGYTNERNQHLYDFGSIIREDIRRNILTPKQKAKYMVEIARGLNQLYLKNICHRDLKPENVLVQNRVAKITDFGHSKSLQLQNERDIAKQHTFDVGTPYFCCPQILMRRQYSIKCDVWSFGVIVYILYFQSYPWYCETQEKLKSEVFRPLTFNPNLQVRADVIQLIKNTIQQSQSKRWNAANVLQQCQKIYINS